MNRYINIKILLYIAYVPNSFEKVIHAAVEPPLVNTCGGSVEQVCERVLAKPVMPRRYEVNTNFTTMTLTLDHTNAVASAVKIAGSRPRLSISS